MNTPSFESPKGSASGADTCTCGRCPPSRIARGLKCFNDLVGSTDNTTRRVSCEMPVPRYSFLSTPFRGIAS